MFVLFCRRSKGSVVVSYQLVLKNEHTLDELSQIMKNYLEENDGKIGPFEVNADSIYFSGKLNFSFII